MRRRRRQPKATSHHEVFLFTSVNDGAVVVEDCPALVQSRNCMEEVEGSQVPLRIQIKERDILLDSKQTGAR